MAACLASVGFIGMVLETLLLLRYQIRNGVVYQQVGWLLTCFMAGMTTGGYIAGGPGRGIAPVSSVRALTGPVATFGAALAAWIAIAWIPATAGLAGTSALLIAAGAAVGVTFAAAAALWQDRPGSAASALYSADVAGGAAGAVAATLLLVPAAGLDWTAFIMAAGAAALLLVIPRPGSHGP
jgi:hypothetical protein